MNDYSYCKKKIIDSLFKKHNINTILIDKKNKINLLDMLNYTDNNYNIIKIYLHNPYLSLINFKKHSLSFIINSQSVSKIPLINKYLYGSMQIRSNYQIYNLKKSRFYYMNQNIDKRICGCNLVNIDLEFINIPNEILSLFLCLPNFIRDNGNIYDFHLKDLRNNLQLDFRNNWPKEYIYSTIIEYLNILGISIDKYNKLNDINNSFNEEEINLEDNFDSNNHNNHNIDIY